MEKIKQIKATIKIDCEKYSFADFNKISQYYSHIGAQRINYHNNNNCYYRIVYRLSPFKFLQYEMTLDDFYKLPTFICVDFLKKES